jgi:hypothetical protein
VRFAGYPHEFTPFGALTPIIGIRRAFAPILLAFGALAPIDQLTVALRDALLQRVLAQYRCDRMRAMPHRVATAYTRAICTTEVRNSGGGLMKVLAWASHASRARYEHPCRKRRRSHCAAILADDVGLLYDAMGPIVPTQFQRLETGGSQPRCHRPPRPAEPAESGSDDGSSIARKSIIDMVTSTLGLL